MTGPRALGLVPIGTVARRVVVNSAKAAISHWSAIAERTYGLERSHAREQVEFYADQLAALEGTQATIAAKDVAA